MILVRLPRMHEYDSKPWERAQSAGRRSNSPWTLEPPNLEGHRLEICVRGRSGCEVGHNCVLRCHLRSQRRCSETARLSRALAGYHKRHRSMIPLCRKQLTCRLSMTVALLRWRRQHLRSVSSLMLDETRSQEAVLWILKHTPTYSKSFPMRVEPPRNAEQLVKLGS